MIFFQTDSPVCFSFYPPHPALSPKGRGVRLDGRGPGYLNVPSPLRGEGEDQGTSLLSPSPFPLPEGARGQSGYGEGPAASMFLRP
jgi:hypothetical protein